MVDKEPEVIDQVVLADNLEKIRALVKDSEINRLIQDKEFFLLAERMASVARCANISCGIFFKMRLASNPPIEEQDEIKTLTRQE